MMCSGQHAEAALCLQWVNHPLSGGYPAFGASAVFYISGSTISFNTEFDH